MQNKGSPSYFLKIEYHVFSVVANHAAFAKQPKVKLQEYAFVGARIWDEDLKNLQPEKI